MSTLDADTIHAIENAYAAQCDARMVFGSIPQDLNVIAKLTKLIEALAMRSSNYHLGGRKGDVDEEHASALLVLLSAPADSMVWEHLRRKTERLNALVDEARGKNG